MNTLEQILADLVYIGVLNVVDMDAEGEWVFFPADTAKEYAKVLVVFHAAEAAP